MSASSYPSSRVEDKLRDLGLVLTEPAKGVPSAIKIPLA